MNVGELGCGALPRKGRGTDGAWVNGWVGRAGD